MAYTKNPTWVDGVAGGTRIDAANMNAWEQGIYDAAATADAAVAKGSLFYSVQDYGALGDGTTDDTLAIRATLTAAPTGSTLLFPTGAYRLIQQTAEPELLLVDKNISLLGQPGAVLYVDSTVPSTVDVIRVAVPASTRFLSIEKLIIAPTSGTPARYGINLDVTNSGQQLANLLIKSCYIEQLGTGSIHLTNPTNTEGFFCSQIEKCFLVGGISLQRCGDSVTIRDNIITGAGIGISLSSVAGAAQFTIEHNNITSAGTAIKVDSADQINILYNQIEQTVNYSGGSGVMVHITGDDAVVIGAKIVGNNINGAIPQNKPAYLIFVDNASDTVIRDNNLQKATLESIALSGLALDTNIGPGRWGSAEIAPSVDDGGVGTRNVTKTPTIVTGWGNLAGVQPATFRKDDGGRVSLSGVITTTLDPPEFPITLFALPVGFRPPVQQYFGAPVYTAAGTASHGIVIIATNGQVAVLNGPTAVADSVMLDSVSFIAVAP